jgi:hypothetical protein
VELCRLGPVQLHVIIICQERRGDHGPTQAARRNGYPR